MPISTAKLVLYNDRWASRRVAVEPWGNEFHIAPGKQIEIIAESASGTPWFHINDSEKGSQIYLENCDDFRVYQFGECLYPGV